MTTTHLEGWRLVYDPRASHDTVHERTLRRRAGLPTGAPRTRQRVFAHAPPGLPDPGRRRAARRAARGDGNRAAALDGGRSAAARGGVSACGRGAAAARGGQGFDQLSDCAVTPIETL